MGKKISCIIPAWNEAKTIGTVVDKLKNFVDEIIVVDDASSDETAKIAKEHGAIVLSHICNRDQGAALQTGNTFAIRNGANIVVHFDADDQFVAEEIPDLCAPIISGDADIVFGSRFLGKKSQLPVLKEFIIMPIARGVNKIFFDINLRDPQSGFRAMTAETARKIQIEQDGKAHCSEILHKAFALKLKIVEVPITVRYFEFGQKFSGGVRIVKDIILGKLIH